MTGFSVDNQDTGPASLGRLLLGGIDVHFGFVAIRPSDKDVFFDLNLEATGGDLRILGREVDAKQSKKESVSR